MSHSRSRWACAKSPGPSSISKSETSSNECQWCSFLWRALMLSKLLGFMFAPLVIFLPLSNRATSLTSGAPQGPYLPVRLRDVVDDRLGRVVGHELTYNAARVVQCRVTG